MTNLEGQATGLSENTVYRWRARVASRDPYFPRSRWVSLAGNSHTEAKLRTAGCDDVDGDGRGRFGGPFCDSPVPDCNDASAAVWDAPGPTANLRFVTKTGLTWDPPSDLGGTNAIYDILRSTSAQNLLLADCVESGGSDLVANDATLPPSGHVRHYLTRARNACPDGLGSLGTTSTGVERVAGACP